MRVWDIEPERLCRSHLLGEHREIHALWVILTQRRKGYANHPETRRWRGKLKALFLRHERVVEEMQRRGYRHRSSLPAELAVGEAVQEDLVDSLEEQERLLKTKRCDCRV